jgi:hypothetical protein
VTETRVAAAVVATKITASTAMAGAQTRTINNQLKAAVATAMKTMMVTATTTTKKMIATAVAVAVTVGGSGSGPCRLRKMGGRGEDMAKRQA